jgi:general secretion pathway protein I
VRGNRGFTLLELIVATMIMGIAIVGLLEGIAGSTRNAARLRDYDRVTQLARHQMDEMLVDQTLPRNTALSGSFTSNLGNSDRPGSLDAGWTAQLTTAQMPPVVAPGFLAIDRLELDVWWTVGPQRRSFSVEGFRQRTLTAQDVAAMAVPQ